MSVWLYCPDCKDYIGGLRHCHCGWKEPPCATDSGEYRELQEENERLERELADLRTEVEALRADAVIEFEPGRTLSLRDLLTRVLRAARVKRGGILWVRVAELFCLGSSHAHHLCRWSGRDPHTGKDIAARKGEGST